MKNGQSTIKGLVILAASISSIYIFGYDFVTRKCKEYKSIGVGKDVGSYLEIMQTIKHPVLEDESSEDDDESEKISILMSNVKGQVEVFSLNLAFEFGEGYIGELGDKSGNFQGNGMSNFLNDSEVEIPKNKNGISAFNKKAE